MSFGCQFPLTGSVSWPWFADQCMDELPWIGGCLGLICFDQEELSHMGPNTGLSIKNRAGQWPSEGTVGTESTLKWAHSGIILAVVKILAFLFPFQVKEKESVTQRR